jgi:uncharacterized protein YbaP (TraB family)
VAHRDAAGVGGNFPGTLRSIRRRKSVERAMRRLLLLFLLPAACAYAAAQERPVERLASPPTTVVAPQPPAPAAKQADDIVDMDTMVVTGVQPGPGLWKVSKGDNVLWIIGTLSPLPRRMQWRSEEVERVIAQSQAVISSPSVDVDAGVGLVRGLFLLPSLLKARRNPDGRTLQQILSPADYARWQALKARYIGRKRGIEQWRPVFAALELYESAIKRSGMTQDDVVGPVVRKAARRQGIEITKPEVTIKIANAKRALKEFSAETLEDRDCFVRTLDRIEGDLGTMAARANAWAIGDVERLRDLPAQNQFTACTAAFTGTEIARRQGVDDLPQRIRREWLAAADAALAKNRSTFATLPVGLILLPDGPLAALEAKGYLVEAPGLHAGAPQPAATLQRN